MAVRILVNLSGHLSKGVRRETWNGRRYLVAPITMIVPGVLPGSQGALLYPSQEVARNAADWDGIPITVYHPSDPLTNQHLSARSQGVWKRQGIGRVRNSVFNGKLRCEGWFDEERTRRIDNRIAVALLNNKTMEISTGLYTDNEPQRGSWNGRQYEFIARNYRPDHLAILPDQIGACSRQDGCGIHVNAKKCKCGGTCSKCSSDAPDEQGMTKNMRRSFWRWFGEAMGLTRNAAPSRDAGGLFSSGRGNDADEETEAAEKGMSVEELHKLKAAPPKPVKNKREKCPECGGDMEDSECDDCGYVENTRNDRASDAVRRSVAVQKASAKYKSKSEDDDNDYDEEVENASSGQNYDGTAPAKPIGKKNTKGDDGRDIDSLKKKGGAVEADEEDDNTSAAREESETDIERDGATQNKEYAMNWLELLSHDPRLTTNMPAGGAFSGAKAAGYSAGQAAAMAGKLEGSYDGGGGGGHGSHQSLSKEAKEASTHAEKTKTKSAHKAAAEAHKHAADAHENEGNTEHAAAHKSAARSHSAKAAKMSNNREYIVNWMNLLSNDPQLTCNMPAGGAFSGAKAAGFSAAQAAAMAGKLEGSYDSGGGSGKGGSSHTSDAKAASEHAEKTKSKSAHKAAAAAHKDAAEHHEGEGNTEMAASHKSAARSHAAKAARMARNEASATGAMGSASNFTDDDADGDDDPSDYESDAGNLDPSKAQKGAKMKKGVANEVNEYAAELYNREKKQLVQQLTSNMRDPSRKQLAVRRFSQKGLGELRELVELLPPTTNQRRRAPSPEEDSDYTQNYLGAGIVVEGGRQTNNTASDDLLESPTINFQELAAENFGRNQQRRQA